MRRLKYILIGVIAAMALGGTAAAANHYLITSVHQIQPNVVAQLKGNRGRQGSPGARGLQGIQGAKGDIGGIGAPGAKGDAGAVGAKGDAGSIGPIGPQGAKGDPGTAALKGDPGATGLSAYDSWIGLGNSGTISDYEQSLVGPKGDAGDKGSAGAVGPAGPQGPKGDNGATGAVGPQGLKGDNGATGPAGPQGLKGDKGDVGAVGPAGSKGDAGPQGPKGDTGAVGGIGPAGPAGPAGPKGDTGAPGVTGQSNGYYTDTVDAYVTSGTTVTLASLNLPAGDYILQGTATPRLTDNSSGSSASIWATISVPQDGNYGYNAGAYVNSLTGLGAHEITFPLLGRAHLTTAGGASIVLTPSAVTTGSIIVRSSLTATQVGTVH